MPQTSIRPRGRPGSAMGSRQSTSGTSRVHSPMGLGSANADAPVSTMRQPLPCQPWAFFSALSFALARSRGR